MTTQEQVVEFIGSRLRKMGVVFDLTNLSSLDFATSGVDSLEMLEFIMEVEDRFKVVITDSAVSETTTVDELASHITQLMESGGTRG
jgi:acyl carrier protein